jgi:hypothetical protein
MTDQHSGRSSEPQSGNGKGENFPEPHAWALEWDITTPAQFIPVDDSGFPAEQESSTTFGVWEKFPQPRGWSLQWDGSSIAATQESNTWQTPPTTDGSAPPATQD